MVHVDVREEQILDSGPFYHEFHADAFIKEPWNAWSSLFFLVPVLYWLWKLRGQYKDYMIITILLPFLFLNGVGSTLYHAFRSADFFMLLDGAPASLMTLILSIYLWNKVLKSRWKTAAVIVGFYAMTFTIFAFAQQDFSDAFINIGYLLVGICFITPLVITLVRTKFYKGWLVVLTLVFLGAALTFRSLDYPTPNPFPEMLPQGTHFLWHLTSALAVFSLGYYFYFSIRKSRELTAVETGN